MKAHIRIIFILAVLALSSCEDVIDVNVSSGKTRLVIEASLDWEKGTNGNNQTITLSTSTGYFNTNENTSVVGALVKVINTNTNEEFVFNDQNNGTYITNSFVPIIDDVYKLEVLYDNEVFIATETLNAVPEIKAITQSVEGAFDDELLEVNIFWDDPANEENYYLISYYENGDLFPYLEDASDEFSNGNEMYDFFEKDEDEDNSQAQFQPGDTVEIELYGISEAYYNYIRLLIEQYYSGGDPFSSNAAELKGNCINQTNEENYAYGYFRLTEVVKTAYTFQ